MADGDLDGFAFGDEFVRAGRHEETADERLARLTRIARENARSSGWRQGSGGLPPALAPRSRPRRRRAGRLLLALVLAVGVLGAARVLQDGDGLTPSAALFGGSVQADGAAQPEPAQVPVRLGPLPPDPGGEGGFRFLHTQDDGSGRPVTYDPCRPVRYVVRRAGEPAGGDALLEAAVAEIAAATGLVFSRGPDTDEAPSDRREVVLPERYGDDVAPVLVAWSDERESPDLAGYIAGYAGSAVYGPRGAGVDRYVTGQVVLDAEDLAAAMRAGGSAQARSTVLHELAHLVGLAHVADRSQIMFSEGGDNRVDLGDGDRRGLRLLGDGACHTDWEALTGALR